MHKGQNRVRPVLPLALLAGVAMVLCSIAIVPTNYRTGVAVIEPNIATSDRGYHVPEGHDGYVAACAIAKGEEILADKV
jgi:hypothetical protein